MKQMPAEYELWFERQPEQYQDQAARADKNVLKRIQQLALGQTSIPQDSDTFKPNVSSRGEGAVDGKCGRRVVRGIY